MISNPTGEKQLQLEKQELKSSLSPKVSNNFSEEMTIMQLSQWLSSHPKIGTDYQADINILKGMLEVKISTIMIFFVNVQMLKSMVMAFWT